MAVLVASPDIVGSQGADPTTLLLIGGAEPGSDSPDADALLRDGDPTAFEISRAGTLAEAWPLLEQTTTECAIVDLRLRDPEILDMVRVLAGRSPAVAVIVLTSGADERFGEATIEAGASDCLAKPSLDEHRLVHSIRQSIVQKRTEVSLAEAQSIAMVGSWELHLATRSLSWSRELSRLFAFPLSQSPSYEALIERTHPDDQAVVRAALAATTDTLSPFAVDHRVLLPDGSVRWVRARGRVEIDSDGTPERLLGTAQDITDQKAAEDAALQHSLHDQLTALPNRMLLVDRVDQALHRLVRRQSTVAVFCVDIDRFTLINDSLGHAAGDSILQALSERIAGLLRPEDTLARTGGDEFVVVCEGLSGEADVVSFAERICASVAEPLVWDGGDLIISITVGAAVTTSGAVGAESLLRDSSAAMHQAKTTDTGRAVIFTERMRTSSIGRLDTERTLRRAIEVGELHLHYQAVVGLGDGLIVGHEALVRWAHPTRGLLAPGEFIAIAEETGLIVPLGEWVLREACAQAKRFQTREPKWGDLTMSVNLSGGQIRQHDLTEMVASAISDSALRAEHLTLEMTESVLMEDATTTTDVLQSLKDLGVRLAIDDFGTAYSSLSYLRRFPVDILKIDQSFVSGLGGTVEDSAIVAAIVSLADILGLSTTAEGVETELQRDSLIDLNCVRAQGYLFGRPVAPSEMETVLDLASERSRRDPGSSHIPRWRNL